MFSIEKILISIAEILFLVPFKWTEWPKIMFSAKLTVKMDPVSHRRVNPKFDFFWKRSEQVHTNTQSSFFASKVWFRSIFLRKYRFFAIFHTFSIVKTVKTNKSFAHALAHLREVQFFAQNFLLAYWRYGEKMAEAKFGDF